MNKADLPVAVLDSGIGGVTVLRELVKLMPEENFIYLADSANAPYGTKSTELVREITLKNVEALFDEGIKAVVIACNTATGAAAKILRETYDLPVVGIEPAIKMAADLCDRPSVLVMATPLTLKQEKFIDLKNRFENSEDMTLLPCAGLVELIEEGHTDDGVLDGFLERLFEPLGDKKFDAAVLGCTHYPLAAAGISKRLPGVRLFDGSAGVARQTKRRLESEGLKRPEGLTGTVEIRNSLSDEEINRTVRKYLYT